MVSGYENITYSQHYQEEHDTTNIKHIIKFTI